MMKALNLESNSHFEGCSPGVRAGIAVSALRGILSISLRNSQAPTGSGPSKLQRLATKIYRATSLTIF
jgi:hypothetical protein